MTLPTFQTRPYEAKRDQPLVYSNWLNQIRGVHPFKDLTGEEFTQHRAVLGSLLARHGATMAVSPADADRVYGWICANDPVLHFVYVRNTFRQLGIGTQLMRMAFANFKEQTIYYTHPTRAMRHFRARWNAKPYPYGVLT